MNTCISNYVKSMYNASLSRSFIEHQRFVNRFPFIERYNHKAISWCSNDYLNMSQHESVISASLKAIQSYGVGSGGTRNISGTSQSIVQLEQSIAKFHGAESGLVFTSGYNANVGTIYSLSKMVPDIHFISDSENHASIIDGIRLSRCKKTVFKHNCIDSLENALKSVPSHIPKCVITESLFSMNGNFSPLKEIEHLCKRFQAFLYVDEIHAVGIYGSHGQGFCNHVQVYPDILQAGFGKAFGTMGGYVVSRSEIIDGIRLSSNPFIFTTSIPPSLAEATISSLEHVQLMDKERQTQMEHVDYMKSKLITLGFHVQTDSHIIPIHFSCGIQNVKKLCSIMLERGHYVQPIFYPTVQIHNELIRVTPTFKHNKDMIDSFCSALVLSYKEIQ